MHKSGYKMLMSAVLFLVVSSCAYRATAPEQGTQPPLFDLSLTHLAKQRPFDLSQLLTFHFDGKNTQMQIEFEHRGTQTTFIGFGPLGNEILAILIREGELTATGEFRGTPPKFIVNHFMLTFLPVADLVDDLEQAGYHIKESIDGRRRQLRYGSQGVMDITYSSSDHFSAEVQLKNLISDYEISIKNGKKNTPYDR